MSKTKSPKHDAAEMTLKDLVEAYEKGEIELPTLKRPSLDETFTKENVEKFILGEKTWAELIGMTAEEAYTVAQFGYAYFAAGRYHDALKVFGGLQACNPTDAYFHTMCGACYQQLDMQKEAFQEYDLALRINPNDFNAYVNRGEMYLQQGDLDRGVDDLKKAVALDPEGKNPAGQRARATLLGVKKAIEQLKKQLKKHNLTEDDLDRYAATTNNQSPKKRK